MKKYILSILAATLLGVLTVSAVPAKRVPYKVTQPDGSTVMLVKSGDERFHLIQTLDNYPVVRNADGYYCFATVDASGNVSASDLHAAPLERLDAVSLTRVKALDAKAVRSALRLKADTKMTRTKSANAARLPEQSGVGLVDDSFLGRKELTGLVILAQYSDVKYSVPNPKKHYSEMLNREGYSEYGGTGSARDFFLNASSGKFNPTFDVYGPVTLPNTMKFYGGNDRNGNDQNPAQMIVDACKGLDSEIDFSKYDLNGDGEVDNVFVFYAGYGEASSYVDDTVWPHQWELNSAGLNCTLDGVRINKYACSNELEVSEDSNEITPDGVGTFIHEFSHVLGLPDLYDTAGDGEWTPGAWDVMDLGPHNNNGRTPPTYSAYERNALGWIDPVVVTSPESLTLKSIIDNNEACLIPVSKNEFFLLENRQQTGWDKYLPGSGLLIWHIDYNYAPWYNNTVNNTRSHQYVDLEEACNETVSIYDYVIGDYYVDYDAYYDALADYAFPGNNATYTSFTDDTKPSMKPWGGKSLGLPVTDIKHENGIVTFNVAGGRCDVATPEPVKPSEISLTHFVAKWNPVDGATEYFLTVEAERKGGVVKTTTVGFESAGGFGGKNVTLPDGWTFSKSSVSGYNTGGNYGEAVPSLKFDDDGVTLTSPDFDNDVTALSFWVKGMGTTNSYLTVEGRVGQSWVTIYRCDPIRENSKTEEINNIPDGVKALRFVYTKKTGNLALDDIKITTDGSGIVVLPDYNNLSTGLNTSHRVDKLLDGIDEYTYRVSAADANGRRAPYSENMAVKLGEYSGVESVSVDNEGRIIAEGMNVTYTGTPGATVNAADITGRLVATNRTDESGTATMTLPSAGIYLIVTPSCTYKVSVR